MKLLKSLKAFDTITKFRIQNAFLISVSTAILSPVMTHLYGLYMVTFMISLFSISYTLAVKTNPYFVKLGNEKLFRLGIFVHIIFTLSAALYFWSPVTMVYMDSISTFIEICVFSAYSITLQNYITKYYPESVPEFQIVRNDYVANGTLFGLILSTGLLLISVKVTVIVFLIFNFGFSLYLLNNWNIFNQTLR